MTLILSSKREASRRRGERMSAAKKIGSHTKKEWEEMKSLFKNTCVICFGNSGLNHVEKDHIIPISIGGSNSISNIQPVCYKCNSKKGTINKDYRYEAAIKLNIQLPENYKLTF